jgi:hypothetical protein
MCRPAGEYRLNLLDGKAGDVSQICVSGVHHQCSLNIVERPPFEHQNLATATLLGRSAEDANTSTKLCRYGGGGQTGPQTGRGDDVVTTGVTDSGQSVVFAQNRYQRSLASSCCLERCLEAVCGPDYVHSFGLEHPCKEFVCEVFLKPEFRLGVYLMRCGDQGVSQIIDLLKDPLSCPNHGCVVCHRRIVPLQPGPIVTGVQAGSDDKAQHGRFHTHGDVSVGTDRFRIKVDRHWMPERHLHRRLSRVGDAGMRQVGTGVQPPVGIQALTERQVRVEQVQQTVTGMRSGRKVPVPKVGPVRSYPATPGQPVAAGDEVGDEPVDSPIQKS